MDVLLHSGPVISSEETAQLECHCFVDDSDLENVLIKINPHVLISVGDVNSFPKLLEAPFEIRRRWMNYPTLENLEKVGAEAFNCYMAVCLDHRAEEPLISIFTPTFRTGDRFKRAYSSVVAQAYRNWEWVILDDSDDAGITATMLQSYAERDHRLKLILPRRHSGVIGEVKYQACMATQGDILVELDHDDELTTHALSYFIAAYRKYPQCGFYYSDNAEVGSDLSPLRYPDGWGWGYGSYREETYRGKNLFVTNAPNINAKTIRGLVAAPNHLRAWRRDLYLKLVGTIECYMSRTTWI